MRCGRPAAPRGSTRLQAYARARAASAALSISARTSSGSARGTGRAPSAETISGSVLSGPPDAHPDAREVAAAEALLQRLEAVVPGEPAAEPDLDRPNGRSISSCTATTWSRSTPSAPRAGPAELPDSFM